MLVRKTRRFEALLVVVGAALPGCGWTNDVGYEMGKVAGTFGGLAEVDCGGVWRVDPSLDEGELAAIRDGVAEWNARGEEQVSLVAQPATSTCSIWKTDGLTTASLTQIDTAMLTIEVDPRWMRAGTAEDRRWHISWAFSRFYAR